MKVFLTYIVLLIGFSAFAQTKGHVFYGDDGTLSIPDASISQAKVNGLVSALGAKQDALPTVTGNGGKFLRVNAGATAYELATLAGGGDMVSSNNLSDVANAATARTNLGVNTQAEILLAAYPVGSIYISVSSTDPGTLFGGTWAAFGAGRVLVGRDAGDTDFDVAEETRGSKTVTIGAANLPELGVTITDPGHNHVITELRDATTGGATTNIALTADASSTLGTKTTGSRVTGITATANTGGANTPISIIQPAIVVYMWKRTG